MLIHLGDEIAHKVSQALDDSDSIVHAIQNLAQARAQGDHVITGTDKVFRELVGHERLSATTRGVLRRVAAEQSQVGGLRERVRAHVYVSTLDDAPRPVETLVDGRKIVSLPLARFQRNDIAQPTFFIAENLIDCHLYFKFSHWISRKYFSGLLPTTLKGVFVPGGGDTTDRVLAHFSQENRYLAVCFTDSDLRRPGGSKGQTAKKCEAVALNDICHHMTLDVRAAENLLSARQIESVLLAAHERSDLLAKLNRIRHLDTLAAWAYLPLKDGVREIVGPHKPNSDHAYWLSFPHAEEEPYEGYVFPGISSKILTWTVDHLMSNDPESLDDTPDLLERWKKIAEMITSWFCGMAPLRS